MKKAYTKPELFCEEYELSASIAGNCGVGFGAYNVTTSDYKSCGYRMGRGIVFIATGVCTIFPSGEGADGTFCYQVPNPAELAFSS